MHYFAEFSGERHRTAAFNQSRLDLQHFTTNFSPGEAGGQTNFTFGGDALLAKLNRSQHFLRAIRAHYIFRIRSCICGDKLAGHLAAARTNLALQIADPGFARVVSNDFQNSFVAEFELLGA